MDLADSHCHLDASGFDADRDQVLARARMAGVRTQIIPAVTASGWPALRDLCRSQAGLFPAYGLHPMFLDQHRPGHLDQLEHWLDHEMPVAVGECGLDFFIPGLDPEAQRRYFARQLGLARDRGLAVIVHARRAVDEVIASVRRVGRLRGVIHSFSGSDEQARQLWRLGFCLGIGGPVTYPRANRLRQIVAAMPIEQLLLETDAPDQPDADWRGRRNEPSRLPEILRVVAELRRERAEVIAAATLANTRRLFGLD